MNGGQSFNQFEWLGLSERRESALVSIQAVQSVQIDRNAKVGLSFFFGAIA